MAWFGARRREDVEGSGGGTAVLGKKKKKTPGKATRSPREAQEREMNKE